MKKRTLGKSGPTIGEVGIGCWQFGGDFGPMTESTAMKILQSAVTSGTDFFDTADVYGAGVSERIIGRFLKTCDTPVTVATKYGRTADVYPDGYSLESMRSKVLGSIERLGIDSLDLLQLHCTPMEILQQGTVFDWLRELKRDGLIKDFGASVESVEEARVCLKHEDLLSLQVIFNIFRQKLVTELLPEAQEKGVGIIVRLPLASGLLAGKYSQATTFAETDHRSYNRDGQCFNVGETFAGLPFSTGVDLSESVSNILPSDTNATMAQLSLRWILDHEAVSVVIPGASSPQQATDNARASDLNPLRSEIHAQLRDFYRQYVQGQIRGPY